MSLVLVINPRTDADFAALVDRSAADAASPQELQDRLRATYPRCVVRRRLVSNEPRTVWYVYRDGHWIPSLIQEGSGED